MKKAVKKKRDAVKLYADVCGGTHRTLAGIAERERRSLRKTVSVILENLVESGQAEKFLRAV